jgi:hypothetical protein
MLNAEDGLRERVAMLATFGCAPMSRFYGHIQIWKMAKLANSLCGHLLCKLATFSAEVWNFHPDNPKSPVELAHGRKNGRG